MSDNEYMRGNEFIKRVQKYAKTNSLPCEWHRNVAGEARVAHHGERFTVVRNPKDELKTGTLHAMLKQLNLKLSDICNHAQRTLTVKLETRRQLHLPPIHSRCGWRIVVTFRDVPEAITQGRND
jgi:mRNA interferase HicA